MSVIYDAYLIDAVSSVPAQLDGDLSCLRVNRAPDQFDDTAHGIALVAPVKAGNVEVHWPEGNVLIARGCRSPEAEIPDYNAIVWIEPLAAGRV